MAKKPSKVELVKEKIGDEVPDIAGSDNALAEVSRLAKLQHAQILRVAQIEQDLEDAKLELRKIAEDDLPTAMLEAGLSRFVTDDGLIVDRKSAFTAAISKLNEPAAYAWLNENGFGGIIKTNLDAHFDRGDKEKADEVIALLREQGIDVDVKQSIHASTLKSFVKERMEDTEAEVPFPQALFGCFPYNIATVKAPKAK
jgi:hypothetical protein